MKKKWFTALLCLVLLAGFCPGVRADGSLTAEAPAVSTAGPGSTGAGTGDDNSSDAAAETPDPEAVEISDADGLRAMADDPSGSYVLTANIDMTGEEWTPVAFSGTLDGAGYTVYNVSISSVGAERETTVDGNHKEYDTVFAAFFSTLKSARIRDFGLRNVKVKVTTDENCFAACLAGYVEDAEITGCTVEGSVELHTDSAMVGVGGIAGFGMATFADCSVDSTLIHVDENKSKGKDTRCEQFTGGVLACGYCSINDCDVTIAGYVSCHGYVHDGGLVGMHHNHLSETAEVLTSAGDSVTGFITFFEDNPDRRAYCEADVGENLHWTMSVSGLDNSFERREVFDYSKDLYPDTCGKGEYTQTVTDPTCTDWGYTTYTCTCGYSYRDDWTAPAHKPGDWEVEKDATFTESGTKVRKCTVCGEVVETAEIAPHVAGDWQITTEPTYDAPGLRQQFCTDCGELLAEEEIPALVRSASVTLSESELKLTYKSDGALTAVVAPDDTYDKSVTWTSSDPNVVTVDENGGLRSVHTGTAVVTCAANDGGASASCNVTVRYSLGQWFIVIPLFGWLWY